MRQLTIPYDAANYLMLLSTRRAGFAFKKSDRLAQHHRLCVGVLPGFDKLSQERQDQTISTAFAEMAALIENNKQEYSGAASTALVCISYTEKLNEKTMVHLITANVAGCCAYIVIKNKMDQIKRYQRLNNEVYTVYDPSVQQPSTSDSRKYFSGDKLTDSFKSVQLAHHTIPLGEREELFLIAAEGIKPLNLAKSGDTAGIDAKNISIVCRHRRSCDCIAHLIQHQATDDNAIAISKVIDPQEDVPPLLIGIFSAYKSPTVAELMAQQVPEQIFAKALNHVDLAQCEQLQADRSSFQLGMAKELNNNGSPLNGERGLSDIYAEINSPVTKIRGFQEISEYFKSKFNFDNVEDEAGVKGFGILREKFDSLLSFIDILMSNENDFDIHRHNILDKYVFFIDKSDSWRQLLKNLKELAFDWLKRLAERCESPDQSIQLLLEYRDHAFFNIHRANHWFQKIGRPQTVIEIEKLIESYKTKPRLVPI